MLWIWRASITVEFIATLGYLYLCATHGLSNWWAWGGVFLFLCVAGSRTVSKGDGGGDKSVRGPTWRNN